MARSRRPRAISTSARRSSARSRRRGSFAPLASSSRMRAASSIAARVEVDRGDVSARLLPDVRGHGGVDGEPAEPPLGLLPGAALEQLSGDLEDGRGVGGVRILGGLRPPELGPGALARDERVDPALLRRDALLPAALEEIGRRDDPRGDADDAHLLRELEAVRRRNGHGHRHLVARERIERGRRRDDLEHAAALAAVGVGEEDEDPPVLHPPRALLGLFHGRRPDHVEAGGAGVRRTGGRGGACVICASRMRAPKTIRFPSVDYSRRATYNAQASGAIPSARGVPGRGAECLGSSVGRARD